jgi:hypothetical protein
VIDSGCTNHMTGEKKMFTSCDIVDVISAPHAKHTASRISWLNTRGPGVRIRKRASQFSLKLTKDENG